MKLLARIAALPVIALILMAQSCGGPGSPATNAPPPLWRMTAVTWSQPALYTPAAQDSGCRGGYSRTTHRGQALCAQCPPDATVQVNQGSLACAACPSGFRYDVHDGNGYCRA
ncbi:MAG TPA: hypothetical protein VLA02_18185 [Reyranella sp.]|nr:hypothetical protein [Reyranella sp.]